MWGSLFVLPFSAWSRERRKRRLVKQLALQVVHELRSDVLRRASRGSRADLMDYASIRAAQLIHPRVDELLKSDHSVTASEGNELIVLASVHAMKLVASLYSTNRPRAA